MSLVLFWRDDNVLPLEKTRTPCGFTNDSENHTIWVHCNMIHFTGCSKRKQRDLVKLTKECIQKTGPLKTLDKDPCSGKVAFATYNQPLFCGTSTLNPTLQNWYSDGLKIFWFSHNLWAPLFQWCLVFEKIQHFPAERDLSLPWANGISWHFEESSSPTREPHVFTSLRVAVLSNPS